MSALQLLGTLAARGVRLASNGQRLRYEAPAGALDATLLEEVRAHKSELLALLSLEVREPAPQVFATVFDVGAAYDPARAACEARRLYRVGEIGLEDCGALLEWAHEAARGILPRGITQVESKQAKRQTREKKR